MKGRSRSNLRELGLRTSTRGSRAQLSHAKLSKLKKDEKRQLFDMHNATQRRHFWRKLETHHARRIYKEQAARPLVPSATGLRDKLIQVERRMVFRPRSRWRIAWDVVLVVMVLYTLVVAPMLLGFYDVLPSAGAAEGINVVVDVVFLLDILIAFNTGYVDETSKEFVADHRSIVRRYVRAWFLPDMLAAVPFARIHHALATTTTTTTTESQQLMVFRALRLIKITKVVKAVHIVRSSQLAHFLEHKLRVNPALISIAAVAFYVFLLAHYFASFWHFTTTMRDHVLENNGVTWASSYGSHDWTFVQQYTVAWYWTAATMMAVGYGDVHATNNLERGFSIVVQFCGALVFGMIIGAMSKVAYEADATKLARNLQLEELNDYMRHRKLPKPLQERVRDHFKFVYSYTTVFPDVLFDMRHEMAPDLLQETVLAAFQDTVVKVALFRQCTDSGFVAAMVQAFEPCQLQEGDVIVEEDDVLAHCYFLVKGSAELFLQRDLSKDEEDARHNASVLHRSHNRRSLCNLAKGSDSLAAAAASAAANLEDDMDEHSLHVTPGAAAKHRAMRHRISAAIPTNTPIGLTGSFRRKRHPDLRYRPPRQEDVIGLFLEGAHFGIHSVIAEKQFAAGVRASQLCDIMILPKESFDFILFKYVHEAKIMTAEAKEQSQAILSAKARWLEDRSNGKLPDESSLFVMCETLMTRRDVAHVWPKSRGTSRQSGRQQVIRTLCEVTDGGHDSDEPSIVAATRRASALMKHHLNAKRVRGNQAAMELRTRPHSGRHFEENEETHLDLLRRFIVPEHHQYKLVWDLFMSALVIWSCVLIPFRIGFGVESEGHWLALDIVVDVCFVLDLLLCFRTTFYLPKAKCVVAIPWLIRNNYLQTWFLIDILATFPVDKLVMIGVDAGGASASSLRTLKLVRTLRLFRLAKIFKVFMGSLGEKIAAMQAAPQAVLKIVRLLFEVWFTLHLISCFWYLVSSFDEQNSWWRAAGLRQSPDGSHVAEHYLAALYWAFTTMTTVGYGDFVPVTHAERVYATVVIILGASTFGYIAGNVAAMLENFNVSRMRHKTKMVDVKNYMRERQLPRRIWWQMDRYYDFYLNQKTMFDETYILSQLPPKLKAEVLLHVNKEIINDIRILKNRSPTFASYLVSIMRPQMHLVGDIITNEGKSASEMFFLITGLVESVGGISTETPTVFRTMGRGSIMGHHAFLLNIPRPWSIRAVQRCSISVLDKSMVQRMVAKRPDMAAQLYAVLIEAVSLSATVAEKSALELHLARALKKKKTARHHHHHHHHHHRRR